MMKNDTNANTNTKNKKTDVGMWCLIMGTIGLCGTMGGVENAETFVEWMTVAGVGFTSALLALIGSWLINDEI